MRKGQLAVQFNWIFVFIIGAVILIFFLTVVKNQTKEADYELAGDIIKNLETVIKSSELSAGSVKTIKIPNVKINFICEEGLSKYDIGGYISHDIPYDIIFSQKELRGRALISWTLSWDVPFRIAFFQYLTTKRAQYIIINDTNGDLAEELFEMLPSNMTKIIVESSATIVDNNYDYYKIINFEGTPLPSEPAFEVHNLTLSTTDFNSGIMIFDGEELTILNKETLFGAIFAHDVGFYNCTMNKAFKRLGTLMNLNYERVHNLSLEAGERASISTCQATYELAETYIQNINDSARSSDASTIRENARYLKTANERLIRGRNCPLIY